MSFPWLDATPTASARARAHAAHKRVHEDEVRYRARLLRGLGRDEKTALARCMAHLKWGYDMVGKPPIAEKDVKSIVAQVYR